MTAPNDTLIQRIQTAVGSSPELQKQLAAAQSTEQAASLLTAALGATVTANDLQAINETAKADMTDEQLDSVAGGDRGGSIFISIVTLGAFCALASVVYAVKDGGKGKCSEAFK